MSSREETQLEDPSIARDAAAAEMARYGIKRVPADMFHYREYRYASLGDALAQAKRDAKTTGAYAEAEQLDAAPWHGQGLGGVWLAS